jgi:hypothetical protein
MLPRRTLIFESCVGTETMRANNRFERTVRCAGLPGSPVNALAIQPPFKEFHLIDADGNRAAQLKELAGNRRDVFTVESGLAAVGIG